MKKLKNLALIALIAIAALNISACTNPQDVPQTEPEPAYKVSYAAESNGSIQGEAEQEITAGEYTTQVTAVPDEDYIFVEWSDGLTQASRTDTVEAEDKAFTAIFAKRWYTVEYAVSGDGMVKYNRQQTVEYGKDAETVTAVPLLGNLFVGWSDTGSTEPERTDVDVKSDIKAVAVFERIRTDFQTLNYNTDGNGTIKGFTFQQIMYGRDGTPVTAIPNDGYEFISWSDGVTTPERQDINVNDHITVTAQFKRVFVRYSLNYRMGKTDSDLTELKFYDGAFASAEFPVPTRELFTFGGWYIGESQVADTSGKMTIGAELLQKEEREIYAKWTANENYTYRILMVYVTEFNAVLPSLNGNGDVEVYYKMSDFDLQICKIITGQMKRFMDGLLDGLVTFEVDEYFTTQPVGNKSLSYVEGCPHVFAWFIPEIYDSGIFKNYDSILTVVGMDDMESEFHSAAGIATDKYGMVYLETVYQGLAINHLPLEQLLDVNNEWWDSIMESFIHELAHTIEIKFIDYDDNYSYHKVLSWFINQGIWDNITPNKYYYLNEVEMDGRKVGIPLEYWKGEANLYEPEDW